MIDRVFVLNQHGKPLMPTTPRKARLLLEQQQATIVHREPFFTIQLTYGSSGYRQPIELGLDPGYQSIGFSAHTAHDEVLCGEARLLEGMSERLTDRRKYRRQRRARKRHRAPRFDNRRRPAGWLAPSIQHKYDTHLRLVQLIASVLPSTTTTVEVASFDIQKIKDPSITGEEYQHGEQEGFWNIREYVLHRDGHTCQNPDCKRRSSSQVVRVHHLGYWKGDRTDRPANLITLCLGCHTSDNHVEGGLLYGWQPTLRTFRPETFMTTIYRRLIDDVKSQTTYGYITKMRRHDLQLPKSHINDAFVIATGSSQHRAEPVMLEQVRRNNRSLQKFYDAKYIDRRTGKEATGKELYNGRSTRNKQLREENLRMYRERKVSTGRVSIRTKHYMYQPNDIVKYKGELYTVTGIQNYGDYIKLASLDRPVKTSLVKPIRHRKGLCRVV